MNALRKVSPTGLAILWLITRAWALASGSQLLPYPQSQFLFSDVQLYDWWSSNISDGHFPINDPMWQYPPLAALIFFAGYSIATNTVGFIFLTVVVDAIVMGVLVATCRSRQLPNYLPAIIWLAAPVIMGPIMLGRFDVFPTLMMILGLLAVNSPLRSGAWFAVGALLKVWPGLGLLTVRRDKLVRTTLAFTITGLAGSILLKLWWPGSFSFVSGQRSRGLQIESVGALPYMWWNAGPHTVSTGFRYGAIEVVANGTSVVSALITFITVIALGRIALWRLQGRIETVEPADAALAIVLIAMITSRVLSPQYNIWIFGILAVCAFKPSKDFALITKLFFVSALCGQILYPFAYVAYQQGEVFPTIVQTIRIATLMWATFLAWRQLHLAARNSDRTSQAALANS